MTFFSNNAAELLQYIPSFHEDTYWNNTGTNTYLCSTNDAGSTKESRSAKQVGLLYGGAHAHDWTPETKQEEFGKFIISYHTSDSSGNTETHRQEFPFNCTALSALPDSTVSCAVWSKEPCGATPKRTVIVVDTLPPVIKLHLKHKDSVGGRVIHTSASGQLGIGGAAYQNNAEDYDHTVNYDAEAVTNKFSAGLMAEQMASTANGWVLGAVASVVTGLALLGYSRRAN